MKKTRGMKECLIVFMCCLLASCEDFLEIEAPDHKMGSEVVFSNDETAVSAMTGIYNELFRAAFSGGWAESITALAGLSAGELEYLRTNNFTYMEFEKNDIAPRNSNNFKIWQSAYNTVYMTNSLLEGLNYTGQLSEDVQLRLEGEAKFLRAFTYFYLVNLYGEVPLVLTTDYRMNALSNRKPEEDVYEQIIADLETAIELLPEDYIQGERTHANRSTAVALLARVQLYLENWEQAENLSAQVISMTGRYEILTDLNQVFLANSKEAIWQISPLGGGGSQTQTKEGSIFIIDPIFSFLANFKLSESLVMSFESEDKRLIHWIGYNEGMEASFAHKYKDWNSTNNLTEYSMVLRLAEQYLIRAEARARQGNLSGAIADVDKIRGRAGIELLIDSTATLGEEELVEIILAERKRELFTEWGHRWLDLKRIGKAGEVLRPDNADWQETDVLYPIPEEERMKNPNLTQNDGY